MDFEDIVHDGCSMLTAACFLRMLYVDSQARNLTPFAKDDVKGFISGSCLTCAVSFVPRM